MWQMVPKIRFTHTYTGKEQGFWFFFFFSIIIWTIQFSIETKEILIRRHAACQCIWHFSPHSFFLSFSSIYIYNGDNILYDKWKMSTHKTCLWKYEKKMTNNVLWPETKTNNKKKMEVIQSIKVVCLNPYTQPYWWWWTLTARHWTDYSHKVFNKFQKKEEFFLIR